MKQENHLQHLLQTVLTRQPFFQKKAIEHFMFGAPKILRIFERIDQKIPQKIFDFLGHENFQFSTASLKNLRF
jgi:hypothetical protein